jgi:hypothetical protein
MNGFTGKRNPGIPRWAQQREFFLVGVAAFGAFWGRSWGVRDVRDVRGTFVGRLGRLGRLGRSWDVWGVR